MEKIIPEVQMDDLFDEDTKYLINPAGAWHNGGPAFDTGLTGRKIVVDNYGADCPIGGGAFSGKDPTKVDRSAAYAARQLALSFRPIAESATVQLSYAIGMAQPISVRVIISPTIYEGQDTVEYPTEGILDIVDLTPKGIIDRLDLRRPIYQATASGGHFGRVGFPWAGLIERIWKRTAIEKQS